MPIHRELLDIMVCPITKLPVRLLTPERLQLLNKLISEGRVESADGQKVTSPLSEALITSNNGMIYRVEQSIPIMLEDQAIQAHQLVDSKQ